MLSTCYLSKQIYLHHNKTETIEAQMGQGWKGPLVATWANLLAQVGTTRTSCPGLVCRQVLSISEDRYSTASMDNLCQCLVFLTVKKKKGFDVQRGPPVFGVVAIDSGPVTGHH